MFSSEPSQRMEDMCCDRDWTPSVSLYIPPGRRKATELSLLTSLVEGRLQPQPLPHGFIDLYLECLVGEPTLVRVYKDGDVLVL